MSRRCWIWAIGARFGGIHFEWRSGAIVETMVEMVAMLVGYRVRNFINYFSSPGYCYFSLGLRFICYVSCSPKSFQYC